MFATDATVIAYVKAALAKAVGENLLPYWDTVISAAHVQAYTFILGHWQKNGYSASLVAQWDFGANFETRLAAYYSLLRLSALYPDSFSQAALNLIDPRKELLGDKQLDMSPAMLIVGGAIQQPDTTVGQATTGRFEEWNDLVVPWDDCDRRLGVPTRM